MIDQQQAKLIVESLGLLALMKDPSASELLQRHKPELFDAYCSLLCMAGIEIPSERDYDRNPQVLRVTAEVYVYEDVELSDKAERFSNDERIQEAVLNLIGGYFSDSTGLNGITVEYE